MISDEAILSPLVFLLALLCGCDDTSPFGRLIAFAQLIFSTRDRLEFSDTTGKRFDAKLSKSE
jgi:hypothetical protein